MGRVDRCEDGRAFVGRRVHRAEAEENDEQRQALQAQTDPVEIGEATPLDVITDGECRDGR